jgi:hypothetical protein
MHQFAAEAARMMVHCTRSGLMHPTLLARSQLEKIAPERASKVCLRRNVAAAPGKLFSPFVTA